MPVNHSDLSPPSPPLSNNHNHHHHRLWPHKLHSTSIHRESDQICAMEEDLEMARSKDTKERIAGVERLHELLETSRKSLTAAEVTYLVDCCLDLFKDYNFRVSQGGLQTLDSTAVLSGERFKLHFNALVPTTVERLGHAKQPLRNAAKRLLLILMQLNDPEDAKQFVDNLRSKKQFKIKGKT